MYTYVVFERLGSGEFDDVVKGYWKSAVEVALKTLSGGQGEEGRRKLLQEAVMRHAPQCRQTLWCCP